MKNYVQTVLYKILRLVIIVSILSFICVMSCSDPVSSDCAPENRTGAVCKDGTTSSATGSGACSGHGGVDHWLCR